MLRHYIKIAFRNLWKYKTQSLISIVGLAVGIAFFSVGYFWLRYETIYDGFHPQSDRIYRIYSVEKNTGIIPYFTPVVLQQRIQEDFPEVEKVGGIYMSTSTSFKDENKILELPDIMYVDGSFLELFPPVVIAGKNTGLLQQTNEIVLTKNYAVKYFRTPENAIDKVIRDRFYETEYKVVSVIDNSPSNSNFQVSGFCSDSQVKNMLRDYSGEKAYNSSFSQLYVLLNKNTDAKDFKDKLSNYLSDRNYRDDLYLKAVPITEMRHTLGGELSFDMKYIRTFMWAGLLLLFFAIVNFLSLYLNRLLLRIKEIRLRKTLGANMIILIKQLQIELLIQLLISLIFSAVFLSLFLHFYKARFELPTILNDIVPLFLVISLISFVFIIIVVGLLNIKLSHSNHLSDTGMLSFSENMLFQKISLSIQLSICIFFLMAAFGLFCQLFYMNQKDWGFKSEGILQVYLQNSQRSLVTEAYSQIDCIEEVVYTDRFNILKGQNELVTLKNLDWEGKTPGLSPQVQKYEVNDNFLSVMNIILLNGRFFYEEDRSLNRIVINEAMAALLNQEDVLGTTLRFNGTVFEIIGVVRNFHTTGFQNPIFPVILLYSDNPTGIYHYVKVKPGSQEKSIQIINEKIMNFMTSVFKANNVKDEIVLPGIKPLKTILDDLMKSERMGFLFFSMLAAICILIAVFGIYALSSFNLRRKRKEIAIRKVLGATRWDITRMVFKEYVWLALLANVIALPLACYFLNIWLETYSYRISIRLWMLLLVILFSLAIVILTVLNQVAKASRENPAEVVKSE